MTTGMMAGSARLPLVRRFPALERLPRATLGAFPSPVQRVAGEELALAGELWIKRDDLCAPVIGGNKMRALEFLLGGVRPGDELLTAGGDGSTHVLSTALAARALGARARAIRWPHEMNPAARAVAARAAEVCAEVRTTSGPVSGLVAAFVLRRRHRARWVPPGGTSPLGMLGHVNAALELAEQVEQGELPAPARVVVPLGSGGTAAGLALGFAIAELPTVVTAARVVPRLVANRRRVLRLTRACAALIARSGGGAVPRVRPEAVEVVHDVYGGAYGRALPAAREAADLVERAADLRVDDTYSAKALLAALRLARARSDPVLFWLTFDVRGTSPTSRRPAVDGSRLTARTP